jgi:hypothetical protein
MMFYTRDAVNPVPYDEVLQKIVNLNNETNGLILNMLNNLIQDNKWNWLDLFLTNTHIRKELLENTYMKDKIIEFFTEYINTFDKNVFKWLTLVIQNNLTDTPDLETYLKECEQYFTHFNHFAVDIFCLSTMFKNYPPNSLQPLQTYNAILYTNIRQTSVISEFLKFIGARLLYQNYIDKNDIQCVQLEDSKTREGFKELFSSQPSVVTVAEYDRIPSQKNTVFLQPSEQNILVTSEPVTDFNKSIPNTIFHNLKETDKKNWFKNYFGFPESQGVKFKEVSFTKGSMHPLFFQKSETKNIIFSKIDFKDFSYTLNNNVKFEMGSFSCLSYSEFRQKRILDFPEYKHMANFVQDDGRVRLQYEYIQGDISQLLMNEDPVTSVFQAASQFNLLEMGTPFITPEEGITQYADDNTQGPRVALASPIGTLFRNYAIFSKFKTAVGQEENQLCTLNFEQLFDTLKQANIQVFKHTYSNGYLFFNFLTDNTMLGRGLVDNGTTFAHIYNINLKRLLFNILRVGVQWNTPLSTDFSKKVCQVYCSALPFGGYTDVDGMSNNPNTLSDLAEAILTAAYMCTLEIAVYKFFTNLKNQISEPVTVYLTAVGGGVFENDPRIIWKAIQYALREYRFFPLNVKLVWFNDKDSLFENISF